MGLLLAAASLCGMLIPSVYSGEAPIRAAQYAGNDIGNFVPIVPMLIVAAMMALRGSVTSRLVWMGTPAYVLYDFLGYALGLRFTPLFLAYGAILGLSFYALAGSFLTLPIPEIKRRFSARTPVKAIASALLAMGARHCLPLALADRPGHVCGPTAPVRPRFR